MTSPTTFIRYRAKAATIGLLLSVGLLATHSSQAAWFDKVIPAGETHSVDAIDRDVAFLIDGYIYDARKFCYMAVGDRVIFFEGRHGIDYKATVYDLDGKERCEVLLRGVIMESES